MNFYEILKTKKLGRGSPDYWTQLFAEHVGGKGEWAVSELTGVLPLTFRSNGTALINYKIYGTVEGAGVQTENLLNIAGYNRTHYDVRWYEDNGQLKASGTYSDSTAHTWPRFYVELSAGTYTLSGSPDLEQTGVRLSVGTCTDNQGSDFSSLGYDEGSGYTFTLQTDSWVGVRVYTASRLYQQTVDLTLPIMLCKTAIAPSFEPYGYKLRLTTTSGTESKTANIYIGDSKLYEHDIIDSSEQKIFTNTVTTVFNGTENWQYFGIYGGHHTFYYDYGASDKRRFIFLICNKYTTTFVSSEEETKNNTIRYQASISLWNINRVYIFDDRFNNVADFKENLEQLYLSNDPLIIIKQDRNTREIIAPALFPVIETFNGTNTLDSTEMLGEVTIKGQIKPQS